MEETKEMTPQQSLDIIRKMMNQSRKDTQLVLGKHMVLWGSLTTFTGILTGYLWHAVPDHNWGWLWLVMSIVGFTFAYILKKKTQMHIPSSYITKTIGMVWWAIGIFCGIFGFGAGFLIELCQQINVQEVGLGHPVIYIPIEGMMMLFFGIAATTTGFILKDYLISICGILAGFGGFMGSLLFHQPSAMPVLAGVAFISMVIPGIRIILINKRLCSNH